jgi:hypothetical protein
MAQLGNGRMITALRWLPGAELVGLEDADLDQVAKRLVQPPALRALPRHATPRPTRLISLSKTSFNSYKVRLSGLYGSWGCCDERCYCW